MGCKGHAAVSIDTSRYAGTLAWMITVAMLTVAATLLVVHWVLRRLVLNPLQHLKRSVMKLAEEGPT
ncbi:MAG: hypothetical protein R3C56_39620 [Pirellulaceae bacterium]